MYYNIFAMTDLTNTRFYRNHSRTFTYNPLDWQANKKQTDIQTEAIILHYWQM